MVHRLYMHFLDLLLRVVGSKGSSTIPEQCPGSWIRAWWNAIGRVEECQKPIVSEIRAAINGDLP